MQLPPMLSPLLPFMARYRSTAGPFAKPRLARCLVSSSSWRSASAGFSLLELLAVIAVFGIIASFTMPAVSSVMRASDLRTGSQILSEQLGLARQMAIAKNRSIEVRVYQYAVSPETGEGKFRAIQTFEILDSGVAQPLGRVCRLPSSVLIDSGATLSSIITGTSGGGLSPAAATGAEVGYSLPEIGKSYRCVKFRFMPDGSTDLPPASTSWFLTLHHVSEGDSLSSAPSDYSTVQIDPANGRTRIYHP